MNKKSRSSKQSDLSNTPQKDFSNALGVFTQEQKRLFTKLNTPARVQDFLNTIPFNFELDGKATLKSPLEVLRSNSAHCFEGALLGAYILSLHGHKPLIVTLKATKKDFDHVIVPFQVNEVVKNSGVRGVGGAKGVRKFWGALSKTNHAVLRYREPVYRNLRELVMSYFHEYFLDNGVKTLRKYSELLDLNEFESGWMISDGDLWGIDEELDRVRYYKILSDAQIKSLRKADLIEREAGKIVEWNKKSE